MRNSNGWNSLGEREQVEKAWMVVRMVISLMWLAYMARYGKERGRDEEMKLVR